MTVARTILLTGFAPFGGERINPSQEVVRALDAQGIGDHRIVGAVLPVAFAATLPALQDLLDTHRPALVLALGQAGGRSAISLERLAINLIDARIADNDGVQPIDAAVVAAAPHAYFSSLPLKAIEVHLRGLGIPVEVSLSAGTFVCNQAFFVLAHLLETRASSSRGGFVHLPWLPEQATRHPGQPSMALETMIAGVRAIVECALASPRDLHIPGGATH